MSLNRDVPSLADFNPDRDLWTLDTAEQHHHLKEHADAPVWSIRRTDPSQIGENGWRQDPDLGLVRESAAGVFQPLGADDQVEKAVLDARIAGDTYKRLKASHDLLAKYRWPDRLPPDRTFADAGEYKEWFDAARAELEDRFTRLRASDGSLARLRDRMDQLSSEWHLRLASAHMDLKQYHETVSRKLDEALVMKDRATADEMSSELHLCTRRLEALSGDVESMGGSNYRLAAIEVLQRKLRTETTPLVRERLARQLETIEQDERADFFNSFLNTTRVGWKEQRAHEPKRRRPWGPPPDPGPAPRQEKPE